MPCKATQSSVYSRGVPRSPLYVSQHASANFDSIKRKDLLEPNLHSKSFLRRKAYHIKYNMIVNPIHNFISCIVAGFLFNLPIMGSIIIVYEKVSASSLPLRLFRRLPPTLPCVTPLMSG